MTNFENNKILCANRHPKNSQMPSFIAHFGNKILIKKLKCGMST